MEHAQCLRLDNTQDHLPECVLFKRDCFPQKCVNRRNLRIRQKYRRESWVRCITCDVHLCLKDKNYYKICHTKVDYC